MYVQKLDLKNKISFITFKNDLGLEVTFTNYGASIYSIRFKDELLTLSPSELDDFYTSPAYFGKTIGRIALRIKEGKLDIDGKTYQLDTNERGNTLHGGANSISNMVWNRSFKKSDNGFSITFNLKTKKGMNGFNGKGIYEVKYKIPNDSNDIIIEFSFKCSENTLCSMTNHTYFNLGLENDILNHKLTIKADKYGVMDNDLLIERYDDVSNTIFDFRNGMKVGDHINDPILNHDHLRGYDHRFLLNDIGVNSSKVILENTNFSISIFSDLDNLVVYTDGFNSYCKLLGNTSDTFHKGLTLEVTNTEPQYIRKNESYFHYVKMHFEKKKNK